MSYHFKDITLVALGGALGSAARFAVGSAMGPSSFPWATLLVNWLGSLAIGALSAAAAAEPNNPTRLFLVVGLLGGFTTFSAFGYESLTLIQKGQPWTAAAYAAASVAGGLGFAGLGQRLFFA